MATIWRIEPGHRIVFGNLGDRFLAFANDGTPIYEVLHAPDTADYDEDLELFTTSSRGFIGASVRGRTPELSGA